MSPRFLRRWTFPLRSTLRAVAILREELGSRGALAVLVRVAWRQARGEPWRDLDAPASRQEVASRKQAGPIFLLVDAMAPRIGPVSARAVAGRIASDGAILFLSSILPRITRRWYDRIAPADRLPALGRLVGQFPNVTAGEMEATDGTFRFTVAACAFADLCRRTGRPELASLFCAGDRLYFERHGEAAFERPGTIADGQACCDFRFRWREPP